MSEALKESGRKILYSMCNWGEDFPWKWAQTMANSWRISGDVTDSFNRPDVRCPCDGDQDYNCALPGFHCSAMNIINKVASYVDKGIPGAWNDMDMLEVGNGGMNDEEYKTHFTMWAAIKSPLIMGNDFRKMTPKALSILLNPAMIAINQDALGAGAFKRWSHKVPEKDSYGQGEIQMWSGDLSHGDAIVVLLNAGNDERMMNATLKDVFVDEPPLAGESWDMYDLWANRMDDSMAGEIIKKGSTTGIKGLENYWYNATAMSYAKGIRRGQEILMGKKVGTVQKHGTVKAMVPRHGVVAYRMRMSKKMEKREL